MKIIDGPPNPKGPVFGKRIPNYTLLNFTEKVLNIKLSSCQKDLLTKLDNMPKGTRLAFYTPRNRRLY